MLSPMAKCAVFVLVVCSPGILHYQHILNK